MTLLDKADIQEQTAHIGPSKVGTVHAPPLGYVAKVEPKRPPAWTSDLLDSDQNYCGGWMFVEDQEPPDDWTDGICWAVNEDGIRSTWPTHWRPSPPSKAR